MSEAIQFKEELLKLVNSKPFVPFMIVMTNGDRHEVVDPHSLGFGDQAAVVAHPKGGYDARRMAYIAAVQVRQYI